MEITHDGDETRRLYEASMSGCTTTLNTLIQRNQLILHKVSLTSFSETPLHISSLLGHVDFTIAILQKCPQMSSELDSSGRSPLHLASAEGHAEIIKALLKANKDVCFARDEDDRIPLHLAAIRGRVEVIQALVSQSPKSISELLHGDTVLHLCVKYNHLEALKLLVETANDTDEELIKKQNQDGNTLLHLAAMLKQPKTVSYIVVELEDKTMLNTENKASLTPLESLDQQCHKDLKSYQIGEILMESDKMRSHDHKEEKVQVDSKRPKIGWWKKLMRHIEHQRNWIEETRGTLMTVATLIAAMTFQSMMNPPSGLWQQDYINGQGNPSCVKEYDCEAGTSVYGSIYPDDYRAFMVANTYSFVGSLIVMFLIISGFPLQHKFTIWVLTVMMSTTIVSAGLSYIFAIVQVTPIAMLHRIEGSLYRWLAAMLVLIVLVSMFDIIRFVIWLTRKWQIWRKNRLNEKLKKKKKKSTLEKKLGVNIEQQKGTTEGDSV